MADENTLQEPAGTEAEDDEEDMFKADDEDENKGAETVESPAAPSDVVAQRSPTEYGNDSSTAADHDGGNMAYQSVGTGHPVSVGSPSPKVAKATTPLSPDAPIPRISAPAASSAIKQLGGTKGDKFGLPADIMIPASVSASLLQGRLLETLRGLPKQLISDALAEYDDAVQIKGESIRNHGAYLYGVVKRYVSVQERANSGEGEDVLPMGPELTPGVNARLGKLVSDGFCTEVEMNDKVKSKIRMLSEKDALFAIEELASVDRTQIRNFGSYFMGILNRYMRGERKEVTSGKKTLAEVRQSFQQQNSSNQRNDNGRKDDRFQRGRDNDPQYRRARDDTNRRERSRDRYDLGGRRDSQDLRDQYDLRNSQQRMPYGQGSMGGNPPPPPPRPPGMQVASSPYQQTQPLAVHGQNPPPMYGQSSQPYMNQPPNQYGVPNMGGMTPGNPYGNQAPQQQRNPSYGQPAPTQYGHQQPFVSQQSTYNTSQQGGIPGPPPSQGNPSYAPTPQYMNQQQPAQQQSFSNSPYTSPPPTSNRFAQPGGLLDRYGNQNSMQNVLQPSAVDILALADKASSAVQALQNQSKYGISSLAGGPTTMQQPPNPYQPSATPQLYGQSPMSVPPAYTPMNSAQYPQQPLQQQSNQGYGAAAQKRRRTTANLIELPVTVQYAVQNLQATGQIEGPLDDGILGMVKDLPEDLALQALQKFSSIDKNTMRNKTAYLAGVLRRELEKIHRR